MRLQYSELIMFISELGFSLSVLSLHFVHLCALIRPTHPRSQKQVFSELEPYYAAHCEMYGGINECWKLVCLPMLRHWTLSSNWHQCHVHLSAHKILPKVHKVHKILWVHIKTIRALCVLCTFEIIVSFRSKSESSAHSVHKVHNVLREVMINGTGAYRDNHRLIEAAVNRTPPRVYLSHEGSAGRFVGSDMRCIDCSFFHFSLRDPVWHTSIPLFSKKWPFFPKPKTRKKKPLKTNPKPYTVYPRTKNIFWEKVVTFWKKSWFDVSSSLASETESDRNHLSGPNMVQIILEARSAGTVWARRDQDSMIFRAGALQKRGVHRVLYQWQPFLYWSWQGSVKIWRRD